MLAVTERRLYRLRTSVIEDGDFTQNLERASPKEAADLRDISFAGPAIANALLKTRQAEKLGA